MTQPAPPAALRALLPPGADLLPSGEGDYAHAYRSGDDILLHARSPHASRCLDTVARLSPRLAPRVPVPVPHVRLHAEVDGRSVVAYPALPGEPLGAEHPAWLSGAVRARVAGQLAELLTALHRFPVEEARAAGVPPCPFPFAFEEDHLREGDEAELYAEDLRRVDAHAARGLLPTDLRGELARRLDGHFDERTAAEPVLLHGELSADHLLFDVGKGELSGVIDLNGTHLGRPAGDLRYVYDSYGEGFVRRVLAGLPHLDPRATLEEVRFLHTWHLLARLLWALDHGHAPGQERWRSHLTRWLG